MHDITKRPPSRLRKRPDWGEKSEERRIRQKIRQEHEDKLALIQQKHHLMMRRQELFAGTHVLLDFYQVERRLLENAAKIEAILRKAAEESGATILTAHFHTFQGDGGGITGALLLAESHITIHTWPMLGFAAVDIFMCGKTQPEKAASLLKLEFGLNVICKPIKRGERLSPLNGWDRL